MYGVEDIHTEAIHTSMIHIHMYGSSPHQLYKMSLYHYWQKNQNICNLEIVTFSFFKSMSLWRKIKCALLFFSFDKTSIYIFTGNLAKALLLYFISFILEINNKLWARAYKMSN